MNALSEKILEILSSELSAINAKLILNEKVKQVGKTVDTLDKNDLRKLHPLILSSVLFFGGPHKAERIKKRLQELF